MKKGINKGINKGLLLVIVLIIIETLILKTYMYRLLPAKYFYDANHIFEIMNGSGVTDISYSFVANIFNSINFLQFNSIEQWGYLISLFFIPILIYFLLKEKKYSLDQYVFIIASVTLLNIYVFGLSKDIIQFVYFTLIYIILSKDTFTNVKKIIFVCLILLIEALTFRVYYAIMAILMVTLYIIYSMFIKNSVFTKRKIFKMIILSIIFFFVEVYVVHLISTSNYDAILNARYSVNIWRINNEDAKTIIYDLLGKNNNYLLFMGNYLINFFRLLFPIELFTKGIMQIVFALYQIYISINLFKNFKYINMQNCLWFITFISFFMISVIFEPDFGSFVRHESAIVLILLKIFCINKKMEVNLNE